MFSPLQISFSRSHHTILCFSTGPTIGHLNLPLLEEKACHRISREQRQGKSTTMSQGARLGAGRCQPRGLEQQPRVHPLQEAARDLDKVLLQLDIWDDVSPSLLASDNPCFCILCCKERGLLHYCH